MKKQLLLLGLGLMGGIAASAQISSPFQGAQPAAEVGVTADYYLYNPATGRWLQNNDDNATNNEWWTTHGEMGTRGLDWGIECLALDEYGNYYRIDPKFGNNHSLNWSGFYLDTGQALTEWIFEPAEVDGVPNAFRICANAGEYPYLYVNADGWLASESAYAGDEGIWQLVTREERIEYMKAEAEANGSADATWLIDAPTFANADQRYNSWIINASHDGKTDIMTDGPAAARSGDGYIRHNLVQEVWSSYSASITQNLTDLPNGSYGMSVQGYYREGSAHERDFQGDIPWAYDLWSAGTETHPAVYYANSASAPLMSIFDDARDASEQGWEQDAWKTDPETLDRVASGKFVPNSTSQASYAIAMYGAYKNPEVRTSVADGNMTIGVRKESGVNDDWIIVDNFRLTYYGSAVDLTQVKEALAQAIATGEAVTSTSTDAINKMLSDAIANGRSVYDSSEDATEIAAATTAINNAVTLINSTATNAGYLIQTVALAEAENVEGEAMTTAADVAVNSTSADEINSALDGLRLARRLNAAQYHENVFAGNQPAAGTYFYLYNVGQKRFLCGGDDWGAHASLGFPGVAMLLEETDGGYFIDTRLQNGDGQHYLGYNGYCDVNANDNVWTFEEVSTGVYAIKRVNADADATNIYLGYRPGRFTTVDSDMAGADDPNNQWKLVTKADRDALLEAASGENPVDASYCIKMPNFSQREYVIEGGWDQVAWTVQNGSIYGRGNNHDDFALECYNVDPFEISQTITDLLPGWYVLSVQGYYRDCTETEYTAAIATGSYEPLQLAELYAYDLDMNEVKTPLVTIEQYANFAPGYGWNSGTSVGWIPNNPDQATDYFQFGAYKNSLAVEVGDDGILSFGVQKEGGAERDWVVLDNFRLTYYGADVPTAIEGVQDTTTDAVKDGKIYNLQGVQVKNATQRGIYIKNGKKFVVK